MVEEAIWMVRAGKGAAFVEDFLEGNFVGIGFESAGEVKSPVDKDVLIASMQMKNPNGKFMMAASQIQRFYDEFKVGDNVLTYDPGQRLYFCLLYTSPSPRDATLSRMPSSA